MLKEYIEGIGEISITQKVNAKKMILKVDPEKGILLTLPYGVTKKVALNFVCKNKDWVIANLEKQTNLKYIFDKDSEFITRKSSVSFIADTDSFLSAKIKSGNLIFKYNPITLDFTQDSVQNFIRENILQLLKSEAQNILIPRAVHLSKALDLKYSNIKIGRAKTKWGTGSSRDEIVLSCRLLLLPIHLIDFIIIHELCHVVHKNHSKVFYELLDKSVGGKYRQLDKELKTYTGRIIPGDFSYSK